MRFWCCCFGDIWEKMNEGKGEENGYGDLGNDESRSLDSRRRKALDRFMDGEGSSGTAVEGESSAGMELGMGSSSNFDEFGSGSNEGIIINVDFLDDVIPVQMTKGSRDSQHKRAKVHSDYMEHHYENVLSLGLDSSTSRADVGHNISLDSVSHDEVMVLYLNPNPIEGGSEDHMDPSDDTSKMEEFEIRMDLTDDLLHMVLSFLGQVDLSRAASVCRQWRVASAHEDFWRYLNFEDRCISSTQFTDMCHRYPNATEVNVCGAPGIHWLGINAIELLRNLEILILGKGQLGEGFFNVLGDCAALKSLSVIDAILGDGILGNGIQEITVFHDRLRSLQIVKCRVLRVSVRCPQLEVLSMKRSNMAHIALNCPQLRELDVGSCHKLSDTGIRSAATSCPLLTSLDMSNCSCVTDETLREIAVACSNLHDLNASYCPNISLESVRLPMLSVLKLDNCEGITSASMVAISHSYMLEVLELDNCGLLTSVSLNLQYLQNIRLIHCRKFVDLSLQSPKLSSITVSNCASLHRINLSSNSLQKLVLQRQESLTTLALRCHCLQEVDLTECESLTNSICDVFSDGGGCPTLRSLILDNCESLTIVRLRSTSLVSLSLVGCRAMMALELTCPYLEQVYLDGCDHLERASFCPVGLRSLNLGICPRLNILQIEAPHLVVLELKGCGVLSEASIHCPRLMSLDASFCGQLTDDCLFATTASCPLIESLILMSCPSVTPDGLTSLRCLARLTLLDLSYTFLMNLQPIFDSCLQLKVLKLQACKYLTGSSLESLYRKGALPELRELDLSYGSLCQSAIEDLLTCCTHLTHVSLNGCVNMHDLNWDGGCQFFESSSTMPSYEDVQAPVALSVRSLQNLNCVGCPNIKKVVIPVAAGCVHLASLNLSLSANLKEVDLACVNLSFLNLSNCCSLEVLKLDCPRLTSLFLQSCSIAEEPLEVAISHCSMLETLDVRYCPKIYPVSMGRLREVCPSLKRIFSSLSMS